MTDERRAIPERPVLTGDEQLMLATLKLLWSGDVKLATNTLSERIVASLGYDEVARLRTMHEQDATCAHEWTWVEHKRAFVCRYCNGVRTGSSPSRC